MGTDIQLFKPNELISAFAELELNRTARHLFNYFIQYAQKEIKFNNYQGNTFEINIHELNELAQIHHKNHKLVEKSLDNLMRPITIRDADNPRNYEKLVPITKVKVDVDLGIYQFKLEDDIITILKSMDLFTKLNLQELNPLKSKHSLIIFEYLKRYENAPKIPLLSIEDLRKMTDTLKSKSYDNFSNLKIKVLDVANEEINAFTAYNMTFESVKERFKGRNRVTAIQFYFSRKTENSEIIDIQATENTSTITTPTIQDSFQTKDPMLMTANELYTVLSKCFSGLTWQEFCESTYIYDNLTIVYFAEWAIKQTHKYHVSLYSQYLMDRSKDKEEYNNFRFRAQNITSNIIESYLLSNCNTPYEAENVKNMIMSNIYGRYHFDAFAQILSDILKQSCPNAKYDYFKVSYEREKHHINAK